VFSSAKTTSHEPPAVCPSRNVYRLVRIAQCPSRSIYPSVCIVAFISKINHSVGCAVSILQYQSPRQHRCIHLSSLQGRVYRAMSVCLYPSLRLHPSIYRSVYISWSLHCGMLQHSGMPQAAKALPLPSLQAGRAKEDSVKAKKAAHRVSNLAFTAPCCWERWRKL